MSSRSLAALFTIGLAVVESCAWPTDEPAGPRVTPGVPRPDAVHPSDHPIRFVIDQYISPRQDLAALARLTSGSVEVAVEVGYDPTGPELVIVPDSPLDPGRGYRAEVFPGLVGLDGRVSPGGGSVSFLAGAPTGERAARVRFDEDLQPLFVARCSCHGAEQGAFPRLELDELLQQFSRIAPARRLVAPGRPLASQLILVVLDDYPNRGGLPMPAAGPPLPREAQQALVSWVEQLGRAE